MTEVRGGQGVPNQKYIDKNCAYIDVYIQSDRLDVRMHSFIDLIFSLPEPKAQGELIVWDSSRRPSVRASVHTFKHEYL